MTLIIGGHLLGQSEKAYYLIHIGSLFAWQTQFSQNESLWGKTITEKKIGERLGAPTVVPEQVRLWGTVPWRIQGVLTASFSLTTLAVAAMVQAVSCCTTWVNSVRSRFMNSKASEDYGKTEKDDRDSCLRHPLLLFPALLCTKQTHGKLKWHGRPGLRNNAHLSQFHDLVSDKREQRTSCCLRTGTEYQPRHLQAT